ncbi:MAG TPA: SOS response-associated peptidase family protein [Parvularculaceae bacterium]|nr:SOS response-associated peptidase family protein [Parvularculaceae bacterium]
MCNRYANRGSVAEIRRLAGLMDYDLATTPATDNLAPQENIYPDQDAAVLRHRDGRLELAMLRWGFPPIPGQTAPITNIRNLQSRWWSDVNHEWITEARYRCLVPFTAFAEPVRDSTWFAVTDCEVAFFAGVWRPWRGQRLSEQPGKKRRAKEERDWKLFAFLTTDANDIVRPIHEKAMPVILTEPAECREWLAGGAESLRLQRQYDPTTMRIISKSG